MYWATTLPTNPQKRKTIIVISPFENKEEILQKIRPMEYQDIPRIAELHQAAMGNSLWSTLGLSFLRNIYRGMLSSELFLGFVYEENASIEGFIAGSTDLPNLMKHTVIHNGHRLLLSALLGVRSVHTIQKLLHTARYFSLSESELAYEIKAESMFCSFTPKTRGKRISGHINKVLFETLLARGHTHVKITTETDNIGANRQLLSWGFEAKGTFSFYGKEMVCYTLNLQTSPRLTPYDWMKHEITE